jgi:anti-sigma regulatory factor (Ser/Thr protein kinase)
MTPLELRVRADGRAPARVRAAFHGWFTGRNWPEEDREDLVFAVSEAVSNAAEHAYRSEESAHSPEPVVTVVVTELIDPQARRVKAVVEDCGRWRDRPSGGSTRGRGLAMIRMLVQSCVVDHEPTGTRVTMISRPVPRYGPRSPRGFEAEYG